MHPSDISIEDYTYELPDERIAVYPANPRDSSNLLIYNQGKISQDIYRNIDRYLPENTALVFNDTKVIKSRILFPKETGAVIEIFCLEPFGHFSGYEPFLQQKGTALWKCMIGKAGKWKEKQLSKIVVIDNREVKLTAALIDKIPGAYVVQFSWDPSGLTMGEVINAAGVTPLPPYIKRAATKTDEETYQTVYSSHEGSVAAPTAGLHFTSEMMDRLRRKGISTLFTTLHVGAGTFKPVTAATMGAHNMHSEWMDITLLFLESLLHNIFKQIISIGTTATRTLESIYWMGNKILNDPNIEIQDLGITQWEPYENQKHHGKEKCIAALIDWMKNSGSDHLLVETGIIIAPGYTFKIIDGLITNFHQPKSTLLLLVAALTGPDWKRIYAHALENDFRFLSYGDGCLII